MPKERTVLEAEGNIAKARERVLSPVSISFFCLTREKKYNFESKKSKDSRFLKRFRETICKVTNLELYDFLACFRDEVPVDQIFDSVLKPANNLPEIWERRKLCSIELGSKKDERFIGALVGSVFYVLAIDFSHDAYRH